MLLNNNPKEIFKIASELDKFNKERQLLEKDVLDKILNSLADVANDPVLVISGKNFHEGVIGIVASRLKDKFNKPVIIISIDNQIGKALPGQLLALISDLQSFLQLKKIS